MASLHLTEVVFLQSTTQPIINADVKKLAFFIGRAAMAAEGLL